MRELKTPSGKTAADENFPVGSWLVPKSLKPHVAAFYAFARAADDIADSPHLTAEDKIEHLRGFARAVRGAGTRDPAFRTAHELRRSMAAAGVSHHYAEALTVAFRRDVAQNRYETFDELLDYCRHSAAPVGRFLIDLHRESPTLYAASDALCNALQVLNHVQDCGRDCESLNRVYLPQEWMRSEGADVCALLAGKTRPALRRVLDRCLDATDELLQAADSLPRTIRRRRFAMEAATVVSIAHALSDLLRRRDPLAERVALSKARVAACFASGIGQVALRRHISDS